MQFENPGRKARPMYRISEVDGHDDTSRMLADLHRLTFFDGASIPEFDRVIGGSLFSRPCRSPLPGSFCPHAPVMRD